MKTSTVNDAPAVKAAQPRLAAWARRGLPVLAALALVGCASGPRTNPDDPFESYNRSMTRFNDDVDAAILKPVATAYVEVTPTPVRTGVSNFFGNLSDVWSFVNNLLQLRAEGAANSFMRVNVNTIFGLGGLLDVASELGIERSRQDFGLTLGRWGVDTGPYVVLPLLGPSTLRDAVALPLDVNGNLLRQVRPVSDRNSLYALRMVDTRANLLRAGSVIDNAALDKYSFTRDVYLQLRKGQSSEALFKDDADRGANDGVPPPEPDR